MAYYLDLLKKPVETAPRCPDYDEECAEVKWHFLCWQGTDIGLPPAKGYCPYVIGQKSVKRD